MGTPLKIGIVLNYKTAEKKKDELLNLNSRKIKWLSLGLLPKYKKYVIITGKKKYVPADVAIGLYIESHYPNVIVDYITPEEISTRRFKKNNLNFVIIYDLLESFHLSDKTNFYKYKLALKNSNNVYPPYNYQKFINNKCIYYKYLAKKGIPVAPTYCISKEKWYTRNPDKYVTNLINTIKGNKWNSIIAKPVYGQEAIGFAKFTSCPLKSNSIPNLKCKKQQMIKYLSKNIPKYKSIVIQEYIPGFDDSNPEIRTFYINGVYMYSMITHSRTFGIGPVQEGGTFKLSDEKYKYILSLTQKVMDSLPKLDLPGKFRNPILTRIDVGSGLESAKFGYFINEVEFVPSLFIEELDAKKYPVLEKIGESLVEVSKEYSKHKLPINTIF
jgi:hypothetical protein